MPTGSHTANRCHTCEASIDTPTTPMPLGDKAPADPARYIPFSHTVCDESAIRMVELDRCCQSPRVLGRSEGGHPQHTRTEGQIRGL